MKSWNFLEWIALAAFLAWSAAGLTFTVQHVSDATVAKWGLPSGLVQFIDFCLQNGDAILIVLAFGNTHLHAVRQWSSGVARRWCVIILVCAFVIEWVGWKTSIPFGSYYYTDHFGPRLAGVPLTIPLAWHVVVTNALFLVRAVAPHLSRFVEAGLVGVLCMMYDFVLEPFATTVKHYWIWTDVTVPPLNYAAWLLLSGLLVILFAPTLSNRYRFDPRPLLVIGITVVIFMVGTWY